MNIFYSTKKNKKKNENGIMAKYGRSGTARNMFHIINQFENNFNAFQANAEQCKTNGNSSVSIIIAVDL